MKLPNHTNAPLEPMPKNPRAERDHVALRWYIDDADTLRLGWPNPRDHQPQAMGWVAANRPIGVIEVPGDGLPPAQLDLLEARFPGRRWFAGHWDTPAHTRAAA